MVQTATGGRSVLHLFHQFQPDLVVLDIMLPEIDGLEVSRQLRQSSEVYVMMLRAKADSEFRLFLVTSITFLRPCHNILWKLPDWRSSMLRQIRFLILFIILIIRFLVVPSALAHNCYLPSELTQASCEVREGFPNSPR